MDHLDAIREILTSGGCTPAQGASVWLWGRRDRTIPIPGMRTVRLVEENARAIAIGPLPAEQMQEIEQLLDQEMAS